MGLEGLNVRVKLLKCNLHHKGRSHNETISKKTKKNSRKSATLEAHKRIEISFLSLHSSPKLLQPFWLRISVYL
jgi:hypothetical protein